MSSVRLLLFGYDKFKQLESIGLTPYVRAFEEEILSYFNKQDFSSHPYLSNKPQVKQLNEAMHKVYTRRNILFCIDVEAWERNTNLVTELGISIYDPRGQALSVSPSISTYHIVIREYENQRNGRFVPDHLEYFNGGVSYRMSQREAVKFVQSLVDYYFAPRKEIGCCLVGHDVKGDSNWFTSIGIRMPQSKDIIDTNKLYALSHGRQGGSLANLLKMVEIPNAFLHNAANDAYYTLMVALKLCDPNVRLRLDLDCGNPMNSRANPKGLSKTQMRKQKLRRSNKSEIVDYYSASELLYDLYEPPQVDNVQDD